MKTAPGDNPNTNHPDGNPNDPNNYAAQPSTPRTDAEEKEITIEGSTLFPPHQKTYKKLKYVRPDFARTLERELSQARSECLTRGMEIAAEKEFNEEVQGTLLAAKSEIERLKKEARKGSSFLDEALNSGDGTYRP